MSPKKRRLSISKIPTMLLIGAGRFGKSHLRVLKELDKDGSIKFIGVVVRDKHKAKTLEKEYGIKTFPTISPSLLKKVTAVDIVTPPETHYELVKKCLPYTHVFVEKPLTTDIREAEILERLAKKYRRVLAVGHIFRYHAVTEKLKKLLGNKGMPPKIMGNFTNPTSTDQGREASFELMHLFDIIHYLWEKDAETISSRKDGRISHVDIRYGKSNDAHFKLGWIGEERKRTLSFRYPDQMIDTDFINNKIRERKKEKEVVHDIKPQEDYIMKELLHFIEVIQGGVKKTRADASIGKKMVHIAELAVPFKKKKPDIAIIGGGIFGTSIACEVAKFANVTLFEKNEKLMQEGTYATCFRHHGGYHYPRSSETVIDIQASRGDFEKIYKKAIFSPHKTYYGIAKNGSHVPVKELLDFCKKHSLPYKKAVLPENLLSRKEIALCIEVPESAYHYETLTKAVEERLAKEKSITILRNTEVTNVKLKSDSVKTLTYRKNGVTVGKKDFDFVINATYANINHITRGTFFEQFPIRIDLAEVVVVRLKIPSISVTVIDGPFATLVPTGNKNEFIVYHVVESILDRYVPKTGLLKKKRKVKSNSATIVRESAKLFPILKEAEIIGSRIVNRGVRAHREHDDNRVADIIDHGFGCWSVLSGKIVSSVSIGKKISDMIRKSTGD